MTMLAKLCAFLSILYLIKELLYPMYRPVSRKQKKNTRSFMKERKADIFKKKFYKWKRLFALKYMKSLMSSTVNTRYKKIIDRLDLTIKPEEIRADQILYTAAGILVTAILLSANRVLGFTSAIFIFLGWLYPVSELEKVIERKNKNISLDFPAFYSMVYYQYSKSVNIFLSDVVKDYIPNANIDMAEELGVMLDNMDYGEEYALKQLEKRVPVHYIIKFCHIMETRLKGYDNVLQMSHLKNEIDQIRIRALEDELERRERRNERIQLVLIIVLLVYIAIYYLFMILDSIKLFQ